MIHGYYSKIGELQIASFNRKTVKGKPLQDVML